MPGLLDRRRLLAEGLLGTTEPAGPQMEPEVGYWQAWREAVAKRLGTMASMADPMTWYRAIGSLPPPDSPEAKALFRSGGQGLFDIAMDWGVNPIAGGLLGTFKGMNANLSDAERDMLAKAFELEQKGMGREAIRQATNPPGGSGGWFRAPWDKKWRMEMDDSASRMRQTEEYFDKSPGEFPLPFAFKHDEAFAAYPQTRRWPTYQEVITAPEGNGQGYFGVELGSSGPGINVYVGKGGTKERRSINLHELQHGVQDIEGFARGGNPAALTTDTSILKQPIDEINDFLIQRGAKPDDLPTIPGIQAMGTPAGEIPFIYQQRYFTGLVGDKDIPKFEKLIANVEEASAKYRDPNKMYRSLAGEAESRLVQARRDLTPAQRAALDPIEQMDTMLKQEGILGGLDDLIVRYGDGPAMAYGPGVDPEMLPRTLREIGKRDELLVRKAEGKGPYRETVREGRQAYEVVPTNTEGFVPYYGSTYRFAGQPEQNTRLAYYDPRVSYLAENAYDEMITRTPYLKAESGLLDEVPATEQSGVIYRGMSAPEYRDIQHSGRIKSKGEYNIGSQQEGTTSFSTDPRSAQSYAAGFAPEQFKPAPGAPAYIVAAKDPGTSVDIQALRGSHERSIPGEITKDDILAAYEGIPYAYRPGWYEVGNELGHPAATNATGYSPFVGWREINNPPAIPDELPAWAPAERMAQWRTARANAALPVEQGGLGLGPANTAAERAAAGGYDYEALQGTGRDITEFTTGNPSRLPYSEPNTMHWFVNQQNEPVAAGYALMHGRFGPVGKKGQQELLGPMVEYPVLLNTGRAYIKDMKGQGPKALPSAWGSTDVYAGGKFSRKQPSIGGKADSVILKNFNDPATGGYPGFGEHVAIQDPSRIRSRFAAFDPMRRHEADLLASIAPWLLLGTGALGAGLLGGQQYD